MKIVLDYNSIDWNSLVEYDETSPTCLRWKVQRIGKGKAKSKMPGDEAGTLSRKNKTSSYEAYKLAYNKSHYDIEDSLQTFFKPGEGVQYDSESGQFWMYVKPTLVQKVLRYIDYHFPGKIDLVVEHNRWGANPWFQNWTQARRYLETVVGA